MKGEHVKVAIVGSGNVGASLAFALMINGVAREIVLIDQDPKRAWGEAMDLNHGASFVKPCNIYPADFDACAGCDIVVITAGAKQKPKETRIDLAARNIDIFKDIIPKISKHAGDTILLVVTNPMDILTYAAMKISGFKDTQVIGSGTVLDTSRLRYLIGQHCNVDTRNVHAYIIGEHGDTELAVWSNANIGGMVLAEYCPLCKTGCNYKSELNKIFDEVKNAAYKLIETKGATYYAIALASVRIIEAIIRDEHSVLPVSTLIKDYFGINDVCLSIPCIINRSGIERRLQLRLSETEQNQLKASAQALKDILKTIGV